MRIRVKSTLVWLYDWNSTDGTLLKVRSKTAARWRRIIQEAMRLNDHIERQVNRKRAAKLAKITVVAK